MGINCRVAGIGALLLGVAALPVVSTSAAAAPTAPTGESARTSAVNQGAVRAGGIWYFRAKHSGKCLTVHGASTAKGAPVDQYTCVGAANQRWRLMYTDTFGLAYLVNEKSGKCLDVLGGGKSNGTKIVQWDCNSRSNQVFHARNLTGYMALKPSHVPSKCLDVPGASRQNNTRLVLWTCKNVSNQAFKPVPA
ncbi:RICIN domain-containing protein [Streptomyces sp. NPDC047453]|uniref:RICIN domain-containing protein n=1 Tax=Streptomyces sp. NPDC047453 TaxID=3154812 RepID=UPI0033FBD44D